MERLLKTVLVSQVEQEQQPAPASQLRAGLLQPVVACVSAACVRAALSLALESGSLVVAVSALMLALLGLLGMARVKAKFFCSIQNDERSGFPDEMPGGLHTHPGHTDLILGAENEGL